MCSNLLLCLSIPFVLFIIVCLPCFLLGICYFHWEQDYPRNVLFILLKIAELKLLKDIVFLPVSTGGLQEESNKAFVHILEHYIAEYTSVVHWLPEEVF